MKFPYLGVKIWQFLNVVFGETFSVGSFFWKLTILKVFKKSTKTKNNLRIKIRCLGAKICQFLNDFFDETFSVGFLSVYLIVEIKIKKIIYRVIYNK